MARWTTAVLALALAGATSPAMGQTGFPPHSAYGESDDENMQACRVTHASAIAAIEGTLRSFNIRTVTHTSETLSRDVILAYVNINALPVKQNGVNTGSCAYSTTYELYDNTTFTNPVTKAAHFGKVMYCNRGGLLVWSAATAQTQLNKDLRSYVTECVKEYNESKN
ncbi:hypothetical protein OKA06_16690 [Novosphingobium sp. MW5]|nr:hypothetical protein [Novosphingobium sp. MW5]